MYDTPSYRLVKKIQLIATVASPPLCIPGIIRCLVFLLIFAARGVASKFLDKQRKRDDQFPQGIRQNKKKETVGTILPGLVSCGV